MKNIYRVTSLMILSVLMDINSADARVTDLGQVNGGKEKFVFFEGKGKDCDKIEKDGYFDVGDNQKGTDIFKHKRVYGLKNCFPQHKPKPTTSKETIKAFEDTITKIFSGASLEHVLGGNCICEYEGYKNK